MRITSLLLVLFLFACSPQVRLSRLERKHPYLFQNKTTVLEKDTTVLTNLKILIQQDTSRFDSLLKAYTSLQNTLGERKPETEYKIVKELRKGAYVKTEGEVFDELNKVGFSYTFDPNVSPHPVINKYKYTVKTITNTVTIKIYPTWWENFKRMWWVLPVLIGIVIVVFAVIK